jgi:sRNA-binding carbon storage regulator CsrA
LCAVVRQSPTTIRERPSPRRCAPWLELNMLVLSRRADESIVIQPADGVDANMTVLQLFANGPIQITLLGGTGRRVKMGIEAPEQLAIRRKDVA